jgi:hypothetical protein
MPVDIQMITRKPNATTGDSVIARWASIRCR